jgi:hypothetical protein
MNTQQPTTNETQGAVPIGSGDLLDGLSVRAKAWVRNKAGWDEISQEEVKSRILDGRIDPKRSRNNGVKLSAELSAWAGIPTCCPMCKQHWPSNEKSSATGDPKPSPAIAERQAPTPVGWSDLLGHRVTAPQKIVGIKGSIQITLVGGFWKTPKIGDILKTLLDNVCPYNPVSWKIKEVDASCNIESGLYCRCEQLEPQK